MVSSKVLILDNGAFTVKAGYADDESDQPSIIPNSVARSRTEKRIFVGDEIESCKDFSGLAYRRPFEKGMLVNWDSEKVIWDRVFSPEVLDVNPTDTSLLLTEPYFNLPNIAETYDQMVFEEWEFDSYFRSAPAGLIPYGGLFGDDGPPPQCLIAVDIGYSYSHVVPIKDGQIVWEHVKRIDVGGKLLTNHLKHLISFRQWNMIDQTYVVNAVREACGYVSLDYKGDLETIKRNPRKNGIVQEYVLPDFSPKSTSRVGYIRSGPNAAPPPKHQTSVVGQKAAEGEEEQVLYMGNERFIGSELLFHPSDIGLKQSGLPETIAAVIDAMPEDLRGMFWANIGIFGGLGMIENLGERLERDLRALCPTECEVGIFEAYDPAIQAYTAAQSLASSEIYLESFPVTRAEYLEHGSSICRRKFGGPSYNVNPPGFTSGDFNMDMDEDERERRYALGLESKEGGRKGKRKEEEEVTSGNWGGRRRRAMGGL